MPLRQSHEFEHMPTPAVPSSVATPCLDVREIARDGRALGVTSTEFESPIPARIHRYGIPRPLYYLRLRLDAELREITSNCVSS